MAAVKESNSLTDNKIITLIREFENSEEKKWMTVGENYYNVDNDIEKRKITKRLRNGNVVEETYKANNKLAHAKYKNMVDEKIAYLLSKPVTFSVDNDNDAYIELVKELLGAHFQYQLSRLGYEASNKGIGWLQVYIDGNGELKTMVIPSEQCIPLWKDKTHTELDTMIRVYNTNVWEYESKKTVTNVEVWTENGVSFYRLDGRLLIYDNEQNNDNGSQVAHYKVGDQWYTWDKVPFVPFKNNWIEKPDIKFVKSLVDGYDLSRSEAANYVEEVKNLIFILKGYGGEDIGEFMRQLNEDRAIPIDNPEDGGVDTITPTMDITALREHYEQLKRDLIEDGQSVNKDLDKFGSSPSGVALKFMYSGLDLKCNLMESEFAIAFESLMYFVDLYLGIIGRGDYQKIGLNLVFNRDMAVNETEQIDNCVKSKGTISDSTIMAHHPYVSDVEEETEKLEEQKEKEAPAWDKVPPIEGEGNEEE